MADGRWLSRLKSRTCRVANGALWEKAGEAAGRPDLIFHDLRCSAARDLISARGPLPVAMCYLGIETDSIFRRYGVVDETLLEEQAGRLQN